MSGKIVKSGWVEKSSGGKKEAASGSVVEKKKESWKKRYCVLWTGGGDGAVLAWYKSDKVRGKRGKRGKRSAVGERATGRQKRRDRAQRAEAHPGQRKLRIEATTAAKRSRPLEDMRRSRRSARRAASIQRCRARAAEWTGRQGVPGRDHDERLDVRHCTWSAFPCLLRCLSLTFRGLSPPSGAR